MNQALLSATLGHITKDKHNSNISHDGTVPCGCNFHRRVLIWPPLLRADKLTKRMEHA